MLPQQIEKGRSYAARDGTTVTILNAPDEARGQIVRWSTDKGDSGMTPLRQLAPRLLADVTPEPFNLDQLLTEDEVAARIGVEIKTLRNWRSSGPSARALRCGVTLPHVQTSAGPRYRPRNVEQFLEAQGVPVVPMPPAERRRRSA